MRIPVTALLLLAFTSVVHGQTADLQISAAANASRVVNGEPFTVTLTVKNNGPDAATAAAGISFDSIAPFVVSLDAPQEWKCFYRTLPCFVTLASGAQATMAATVLAPSKYPVYSTIATVNPATASDPYRGNNNFALPLFVDRAAATADLSITMTPRRNPIDPDARAIVDVTVTNNGPDAAGGAYVQLSGQPDITVADADWTCDSQQSIFICHVPAIAPNATTTITATSPPVPKETAVTFSGSVFAENAFDANRANNMAFATVSAANAADYEALLVPLIAQGTPGALGSLWSTEIRLIADENVVVYPHHINCVIPEGCYPFDLPLGALYDPTGDVVPLAGSLFAPTSLVYTHRGDMDKLHFSLRLRDLSRPEQSWGTQIPVVRERDFRSSRMVIADVPVDPAFRVTLRIYDPDRHNTPAAIVRYVDENGNTLSEARRPFTIPVWGAIGPALLPLLPNYLQIDAGSEAAPLVAAPARIAVEIEPAEAGQRLWAFVSVTSNETQQVTILTDQ